MLALGLILLVVAVLVVLGVVFGAEPTPISFDAGVVTIETTPLVVFLVGGATLLVVVLGLGLIRVGMRRAAEHRRTRKELDRVHAREDRAVAPDEGRHAADQPVTDSDRTAPATSAGRRDADPGDPRPHV